MRSVAVVVFPGVQAIDVSGPMDVFEEANALLPEADRYLVEVVGPEGIFAASNGMRMEAHRTYDEATSGYIDTTHVGGGRDYMMQLAANPNKRSTSSSRVASDRLQPWCIAELFGPGASRCDLIPLAGNQRYALQSTPTMDLLSTSRSVTRNASPRVLPAWSISTAARTATAAHRRLQAIRQWPRRRHVRAGGLSGSEDGSSPG